MFVVATSIQCVVVIGWSFTLVVHRSLSRGENFWVAAGNEAACIVLFLYCFVFFFFVGGLTAFHVYLISVNRTTYENFKHKFGTAGDRDDATSCARSWTHFCCVEVPPSRLRLRAHIRVPERPVPTSTPLIRTTNGSHAPVVNVAGRKPSANTIKQAAPIAAVQVPLPAPTMVLSPPVSGSASLRGRTRGPLPRKVDGKAGGAQSTAGGGGETAYESCDEGAAGDHGRSTATSARGGASAAPGLDDRGDGDGARRAEDGAGARSPPPPPEPDHI